MRNTVIKVGLLLFAYIFISTQNVSALSSKHLAMTDDPFKYQSTELIEAENEDDIAQSKPKPKTESKEVVVEPPAAPPVTQHVVVEGDNLSKIAEVHQTTWVRLFSKNLTVENPDTLNVGQVLVIPTASEQFPERPLPTPIDPVIQASVQLPAARTSSGQPQSRGSSAGNTYTAGYCTWYAKSRRPDLPNSLGNANTWVSRAAAQGLATGNVPRVGAIGQQGMHVVYVEAVNGDGTITISEMNYRGLYVTSSRVAAASSFSYIY